MEFRFLLGIAIIVVGAGLVVHAVLRWKSRSIGPAAGRAEALVGIALLGNGWNQAASEYSQWINLATIALMLIGLFWLTKSRTPTPNGA